MIEPTTHIHLFYPFLIIGGIVALAIIVSAIKYMFNSNIFKDLFFKSSDNAKDVTIHITSKMSEMHKDVILLQYTNVQEQEFHAIEQHLKLIDKEIELLNKKYDSIIENKIQFKEH